MTNLRGSNREGGEMNYDNLLGLLVLIAFGLTIWAAKNASFDKDNHE